MRALVEKFPLGYEGYLNAQGSADSNPAEHMESPLVDWDIDIKGGQRGQGLPIPSLGRKDSGIAEIGDFAYCRSESIPIEVTMDKFDSNP